jgi:hypothetical protein
MHKIQASDGQDIQFDSRHGDISLALQSIWTLFVRGTHKHYISAFEHLSYAVRKMPSELKLIHNVRMKGTWSLSHSCTLFWIQGLYPELVFPFHVVCPILLYLLVVSDTTFQGNVFLLFSQNDGINFRSKGSLYSSKISWLVKEISIW